MPYLENIDDIYGCFCCHTIQGEFEVDEVTGLQLCSHCGEPTVMPVLIMMSILAGYYRSGMLTLEEYDADIGEISYYMKDVEDGE